MMKLLSKKNMLTLEFSIDLTLEQKSTLLQWMSVLKHQWNMGLSALEEYDRFYWYDRHSKKPALACPIAEGTWIKEEKRIAPTCSLVTEPSPTLTSSQLQAGGDSLGTMARADRLPDFLRVVPSKFRIGMLALLSVSWDAYVKDRKNKGKPKYKRRSDQWNCLYSGNLKAELKIDGDRLAGIPKLGTVIVPHLSQRWIDAEGNIPPICAFKIVRRGDKFRLQLTGDLKRTYKTKPSDKAIGIDLGFIYAEVDGTGARSPLFSEAEEKLDKRKRQLQTQLDAKLDQRLILWLHHPATGFDAAKELIRISADNWEKLKDCRSAGDVAQIIGQKRDRRFQSLRHKLPKTKAEKELRKAIAILDRKMAASRKVRDNKFATKVCKKYGHIAIEDGIQKLKLRERPEPIPNEAGGFDKNGAERQSDTNKQLRSLAPGQKISILEQRAKRYDRSFTKAVAVGTTSECPCCGATNEPSLIMDVNGDRPYDCSKCGWHCDQDINAAVNIELRSFAFVPSVILTPWAERARIRSYQLEGAGKIEVNPLWRMPLEDREKKTDPRTNQGKGSSDSEAKKARGKTKLSSASRKSQAKAKPSRGAIVV